MIGLVIIAVLLLLSRVREKLEPTGTIKVPNTTDPTKPFYDAAEVTRINSLGGSQLIARMKILRPTATPLETQSMYENNLKMQPSTIISSFYTTVYQPSTIPINQTAIEIFVNKITMPNSPVGSFSNDTEIKSIMGSLLKAYFIDGAVAKPTTEPTVTEPIKKKEVPWLLFGLLFGVTLLALFISLILRS